VPDWDIILPLKFYVIASVPAYYVVYVNNQEYATGYTNNGNITLKLYSSATINITYPSYKVYKDNCNIS